MHETNSLIFFSFNRIYVNIMNLGNNIKLDILKLVFCLKKEFLDHVTCYNSLFSYAKRKVKMGRRDDM